MSGLRVLPAALMPLALVMFTSFALGQPLQSGVVVASLLLGLVILWWRFDFRHAAVAVLVLIPAAELLVERRYMEMEENRQQLEMLEQLGTLRADIERVVHGSTTLLSGIAALVGANPELSEEEFSTYAQSALRSEAALINISLAQDLVVRYVYPPEGNESVRGTDYRAIPSHRAGIEQALQSAAPVLAGPLEMIQGGKAFIARVPVMVSADGTAPKVRGMVSAPLRIEAVLPPSTLDSLATRMRIAIRGVDGKGEGGAVFQGDAALFDDPAAVRMHVDVASGSWQIAALPRAAPAVPDSIWILRLSAISLVALAIAVMSARTQRIRAASEHTAQMERQAREDPLTGLPNRVAFNDELSGALARASRTGARHALLFIDLDDFKGVNDRHGHETGDRLLIEVASRIRAGVRGTDTVARLSGDEFTAVLYDVGAEDAIARVVEGVVESLARPYAVGDVEVQCGASIGVACYPQDATDSATLLMKADQAMYSVKRSGRNGWHFYTRDMHERSEHRQRLYTDLLRAIDSEAIGVFLQPVVHLASGRAVSCEALARWQRPDGSWVQPKEFIAIAEERGLLPRLERVVLREASAALAVLNAGREHPLGLRVNISPRLFRARPEDLQAWIVLAKDVASRLPLVVEITESLLGSRDPDRLAQLDHLVASGLEISVDDFGIGLSPLSVLTQHPIAEIKIDGEIVRGVDTEQGTQTLVRTIQGIAAGLGRRACAEGVESEAQRDFLKSIGCELAQGRLFAGPMRPEDLASWLRNAP